MRGPDWNGDYSLISKIAYEIPLPQNEVMENEARTLKDSMRCDTIDSPI